MDPPSMNDTTASAINTTPFNLSEIWSIPINGDFAQIRPSTFASNDLLIPELSRKRRDNSCSLDDSPKSDSDGKRLKTSGSKDDNNNPKDDGEETSGKGTEQKTKTPAEAPKDYIHVRARRGQATDSHSLAERARREKISERMRILQEIVPGCNKVIGKALVLDEIINYVQSLQRQVEFLSMKLEAVNSRITPGFEGFPPKDFGQQAFDTSRMLYGSQTCEPPREYGRDSSPEWLHMQLGGSFERQM